jgi:enoyl-CoA hydratase/carnithine racemase
MGYEAILYEVVDHVAKITLNRPERLNAWGQDMREETTAAMRAADADDNVRAVVIHGAGRAFCAGMNLKTSGEKTFARPSLSDEEQAEHNAQFTYPHQIGKPVIAAIHGPAVGVGITYPLLCDIRIVAEDAKISFIFPKRGLIGELGSHFLLPRLVGFSQAMDLLLSGRMISGSEAVELGLALKAVPEVQLLDTAMAYAREYAKTAPVSVAISKRLMWEGLDSTYMKVKNKEQRLFSWCGSQVDAKEGIRSFLEKRAPEWELSAARDKPDLLKEVL